MTNAADEYPQQASAAPAQPAPSPVPALSPALNDPRRKKPLLASILSFMPGLGQVYVGYYKQGFTNAITVALLISFMTLEIMPLIPLAGIFLAFFWLYNVVDAGRRASLYNQALAGGGDIDLPDSFEVPKLGGSMTGGAALIVLGLILLSNTLFNMSLEWLEDWWPVALVIIGGWLVYKAIQDKAKEEESFE